MVTVGIVLAGERADKQLVRSTNRAKAKVLAAARGAAADAGEEILSRGRKDIAAAGNFGPRWTAGLQAKVGEGGGFIKVTISHQEKMFQLFERGGLVKGKPLLWIPLSYTGVSNVYARDYPGSLVKVDRLHGRPLLIDRDTKFPKYFGIDQVNIPKKFHILDIVQDVAKRLAVFYKANYQKG